MGIAVRKEKHDITFATYEEIEILLDKALKDNSGIIIGGVVYSLNPKETFIKDILFAQKKINPNSIELHAPESIIKITKDDYLILGIDGIPHSMNKKVFELSFDIIEEVKKGDIV